MLSQTFSLLGQATISWE